MCVLSKIYVWAKNVGMTAVGFALIFSKSLSDVLSATHPQQLAGLFLLNYTLTLNCFY